MKVFLIILFFVVKCLGSLERPLLNDNLRTIINYRLKIAILQTIK